MEQPDKNQTSSIQAYFGRLNSGIKKAYAAAKDARAIGHDPEDTVGILLAKNMAERVEKLISIVKPDMINSGLSKRILELEKKFGKLDWRVALEASLETTQENFCKFSNKIQAIETGIRVGLAYITQGIVSSPIEGFTGIKVRKNRSGNEYLALMYSGPIRSAGGTGASVSVLIADYIRKKIGYDIYDPREDEVKRAITEIYDYHERITNLQYLPTEEEIDFLMRHLPVQIDGDPSEDIEVSNYKDLERIESNKIRNGPCLVMGECLAQKAPKIVAQLQKFGQEFSLEHWSFLNEFVQLQKMLKAKSSSKQEKHKIGPIYTYIQDLVAGRPVLGHPMASGGFRLRYGRSRISGYSSASLHPATTQVLRGYIATGTQLKLERPGKATSLTLNDSIEGPIVRLHNGEVIKLSSESHAKRISNEISEILYLGDILINYGDFSNRAHTLVPAGYCEEWWVQEVEKSIKEIYSVIDAKKASEIIGMNEEKLISILNDYFHSIPTAEEAIAISMKLHVPLHPAYTYYWKSITTEEFITLLRSMAGMNIVKDNGEIKKITLPMEKSVKRAFELIGMPHKLATEHIVIEKEEALVLLSCLGINTSKGMKNAIKTADENKNLDTLSIVNKLSDILVRDKSGIFIGSRMGRPEKAKMRKLTGSPHTLFPVGEEGAKLRSFQSAIEKQKVTAEFAIYKCEKCSGITVFSVCEDCNIRTSKVYYCNECGMIPKSYCRHGKAVSYKKTELDIGACFNRCIQKLGLKSYPDIIKGVRGTSNKDHVTEHFAKGIIRAKHNVNVNRDGTIRYDMTQLSMTHFRPKEIGITIEKLNELGYEYDIKGSPIKNDSQVIELKPQDVVLPSCPESTDEPCDEILFRTAMFIDELLEKFYGLKPFYNLKHKDDLIGHLIMGLAPHISTGIVGRIIGFSKTQGFFAHPMLHAAMRRDCDGDEASVTLLMDAFLNFSRQFLPNTRGATQDAPLVLTSMIDPTEVDDMFFDIDTVWSYPLEFYEACQQFKMPWEVKIEKVKHRLNTDMQYDGYGFTHDVSDINIGVRCSAYKTLPSMEDKLKGQMILADNIRAVNASDVAKLVIEKHLLRDIKGNLRKFSQQEFRCVKCNAKYRRPPLIGKCTQCGDRLIFTVSEGSIIKYLEPAMSLADKYELDNYLKQVLLLTKQRVEEIFGHDSEKQIGLGRWF